MPKLAFHFLGALSTLSLLAFLYSFVFSLIDENAKSLGAFFNENPGFFPFFIFFFPVILTASFVWLKGVIRPQKKDSDQ